MEDQRSKVLVVDDDDWILDRLWEVLTPAGYEVQTATDGLNAVRLMEETRFEVVLTDYRMPGMDGLELLDVICKRWPDTRVVIHSGISPGATSQFALEQGAYAWISKPCKAAHLLDTLDAAVLTGGPSGLKAGGRQ